MTGELIAWSRPWRRGGVPGAIVRQLDAGMAELVVLPCDGPPVQHPPMPVGEALHLFADMTEVARDQARPESTDRTDGDAE